MIRNFADDALHLNQVIDLLCRIRAREGNLPISCYGGDGADYWAAGIRIIRGDGEGPTRIVFDNYPWPEELDCVQIERRYEPR